jgi:hypothetical protein
MIKTTRIINPVIDLCQNLIDHEQPRELCLRTQVTSLWFSQPATSSIDSLVHCSEVFKLHRNQLRQIFITAET